MAKNLKLNIKNTQIAQAVNLNALKEKIGKKKEVKETAKESPKETPKKEHAHSAQATEKKEEAAPKIKARTRSAFADGQIPHAETLHPNIYHEETISEEASHAVHEEEFEAAVFTKKSDKKELLPEIEEKTSQETSIQETLSPEALRAKLFKDEPAEEVQETKTPLHVSKDIPTPQAKPQAPTIPVRHERTPASREFHSPGERITGERITGEKLGPTGRHVKDLIPPKPAHRPPAQRPPHGQPHGQRPPYGGPRTGAPHGGPRTGYPPRQAPPLTPAEIEERAKFKGKAKGADIPAEEEIKKAGAKTGGKFKEFRDLKPARKTESDRQFDARDRLGLRAGEDEAWRGGKKRKIAIKVQEEAVIRPTVLKVRIPLSIKELAEKMKLKASQLIEKLFLQGVIVTLNDQLADETTIQLLGHEFGCSISIDTSEEERIRITDKSIKDEIKENNPSDLILRPVVVAFMGHVDHGKTSLIDAIRSSDRAAGEAGAITQHIGAFKCKTPVGDITILDTPGHEAFSAMRARGADVTDIVVLVVAGDEGIRQQTVEAIQHAKAAHVTIVVAINKSDKPNFNPENVFRQLSEHELLPESWGGQTITVNCSAVTKAGIKELLEMLALQAEVLELKANPLSRARGTVIESEMHKGMGAVATVLVQNGTLRNGDALVFGQHFGRVKTMLDEHGKFLEEAGPSTPVAITGLSGLPEAGQEFIVVKSEKEAREISEVRTQGVRQTTMLKKKMTLDNLMQKASESGKKILHLIIRADVQGSLEALKAALMKIESQKAELDIIFTGVGEISESDVQLAAASKAVILGFHTQVEGHAEQLVKQLGVQVRSHNIIYHAVDEIKAIMAGLLDKIPQETDTGKAIVKATFKSSHHGIIAGCQVTEGTIARSNMIRVIREGKQIWRGNISSLKRVKEDVREVQKGVECGILLVNYTDVMEGDILEAFEITYLTQEL